MDVGIVAQKGNGRAASLADDLRDRLRAAGATVHVDDATAARLDVAGSPVAGFDACDLVVSIGGDGTLLYAADGAGATPVLGVNLGEVGFLNAVGPAEAVGAVLDAVEAVRAGDLDPREVPRLVASGADWTGDPAVNEVVVQGARRGHGGGVDVAVDVDGSRYAGGHADGVLIATPTGSTAYNLSEGGPLVHPSVAGLVVTVMCAEGGVTPLVVDGDSEVRVAVEGADEVAVVGDGRRVRWVDTPTEVTVTTGGPPLRIAGPTADFFQALDKLD